MSSSAAPVSLSEVTLRNFLDNIQTRFEAVQKAYKSMGKPSHFEQLCNILGKEDWEIDNIVIMGIGNPPRLFELAMILELRDRFEEEGPRKVTVWSQELVDLKHEALEMFMGEHNIMKLIASPGQPSRPISDKITGTTLVFAPVVGAFVVQAIDGKQPELYIGVSMDRQKEVCSAHLAMAAQAFHDTYQMAKVPAFTGAEASTNFNDLVIYRRQDGKFKGRSNDRQAAWKNTAPHWT